MLKVFYYHLYYDLMSLARQRGQWLHPLLFFVIFICLFAIALSFNSQQLAAIAPAMIWMAFLLTSLLTIESIFRVQKEQGMLAQLVLNPYPLWWLLLAKSLALWVACCLPLMLLIPFLSVSLNLSFLQMGHLGLSLLIGSPSLTLVGLLGATLTLGLPRAGIFLGLLLLPLYVPILILGESAASSEQLPLFQIALLGAISTLTMTLVPHATAAALRALMDE